MINITETDLDKFIKSLESNEELTTESMKDIEKLKHKSTDINSHIGKVQNSFKGISQLKPISKPITTPTNSEKKNG